MNRSTWVPVTALGLTALAVVVALTQPGPALQPLALAAFLAFAPGTALLGPAPSWPTTVWLTSVVSLSLAVDVLLTTALFYTGWWSPTVVLVCLVVVCTLSAGWRLPAVQQRRANA